MIYVTAEQMKRLDRYAIEQCGIPAAFLMENAGKAVADEAARIAGDCEIIVFSGYGNNGGDGFVSARYLKERSCRVKVFTTGPGKVFSQAAKVNLDAILKLNIIPEQIKLQKDIDVVFNGMKDRTIIVDAIFGIGIKGLLDGFYQSIIERINSTGFKIVSVDVPSGLDADTAEPRPCAVKAFSTVTFGYPKVGFTKTASKTYTGKVIVADIGLPTMDVTKI